MKTRTITSVNQPLLTPDGTILKNQYQGITIRTNNASQNTETLVNKYCIHTGYYNQDITSITITNSTDISLANGTIIEVYNA